MQPTPRTALAERPQQPISRGRSLVKPPLAKPPWSCRFVPMLSVILRRLFLVCAFLRADLRRSPRAEYLIIVGLLGAEGARELGMATPWATWTGLALPLLITRAKNM